MGSSARKRANKKADFVKPKLKVGKARPKASNITDTSFASKSISIPTQSLRQGAPSSSIQISTHISHLTSHNATQRSDHLNALTTHFSSSLAGSSSTSPTPLPTSTTTLLSTLNPLLLDPDSRVRSQLLKLYSLLPRQDVVDGIDKILPHVRAGMSHLSTDIRVSNLDMLAWLLSGGDADGHVGMGAAVVSCAGGWVKTLKIFATILGWPVSEHGAATAAADGQGRKGGKKDGWTDGSNSARGSGSRGPIDAKILNVLAAFLRCGLLPRAELKAGQGSERVWPFPLWNVQAHMLPTRPNPFAHLNLFGEPRDEEGEMYVDEADRRRVFKSLGYAEAVAQGIEGMRRDGGETGRAAGNVRKVSKEAAECNEV